MKRATRHILLVALFAAWVCAARSAFAGQQGQLDNPVEAGKQAFADGDYPWYDAATDSLGPMEFLDPVDLGWRLGSLSSVLRFLGWMALGLLIAALVAVLFYVARNRAARAASVAVVEQDALVRADQVEALPFLAERPKGDLLGQARRHYQEGNYSEAIIYLFSYQLVELDKFAVIHLAKGKTNRQYLRETSRVSLLRSMLEGTMLAFEDVFFGRRTLDRARFEACWNNLPEFDEQLQSVT
jgi:hypothetical protein